MITQAELKELLDYDPVTGVFRWKTSKQKIKVGAVAGSVDKVKLYWRIMINGKKYLAHRLVWLYMTGNWPVYQLDHINGIPNDNRFCNLRECTHAENHQNIGKSVKNKSGYIGVSWCAARQKWLARIKINGHSKHLGRYNTPEDAYEAYKAAKAELHSFSPVPRQ